jgi:hypothetical protein
VRLLSLGLPEDHPLAGLAKALAAFGWWHHDISETVHIGGGAGPWWWAEFDGHLTREPGAKLPASHAEGRRELYERAEAAIRAARDAGWVPWEPPEIEISGQLIWTAGRKERPEILPTARVRLRLVPVSVLVADLLDEHQPG